MSKNPESRRTTAVVAGTEEQETMLTAAQIAVLYKTALEDFVGGKTTRQSADTLSKYLAGALAARKQAIREEEQMSSQHCKNYF